MGRPPTKTQAPDDAASWLGNRQYNYGLVPGHEVITYQKKRPLLPSTPKRHYGPLANEQATASYDPHSTCTNIFSDEVHVASGPGETAVGTVWPSWSIDMTWPEEQCTAHKNPAKAVPARPGSASMHSDKPCGGKCTGTEGMQDGLQAALENRLAGATP
jgi:hypothetical protein